MNHLGGALHMMSAKMRGQGGSCLLDGEAVDNDGGGDSDEGGEEAFRGGGDSDAGEERTWMGWGPRRMNPQ